MINGQFTTETFFPDSCPEGTIPIGPSDENTYSCRKHVGPFDFTNQLENTHRFIGDGAYRNTFCPYNSDYVLSVGFIGNCFNEECTPFSMPQVINLGNINTEQGCSQAAASHPNNNISWVCEDVTTGKCTTTTDTVFVDATAIAGISLTAFLTGFKNNPNVIDVTKLSSEDKANFLEALIKNGAYPSTIDIIDFEKTTFDPVTGKMTPVFKSPSDPSLSRMSKTTYDTYAYNMKTIKQTFDKTILEGKLKLNPLSPVGILFDELRKNGGRLAKTLSPCLRKIPAIAAFIGAASWDAFAYALEDAGLGDSDVSWTCDPEAGGGGGGAGGGGGSGGGPNGGPEEGSNGGLKKGSNNDGQLNPSNGVFLSNGSFMKHDGSITSGVGNPDPTTPSRSNFIQGNLSTTVNMVQMINTTIPSSIKNNLTLNANYGVPMTNFPILKISKEPPTPRDIIVIDDGKFIPGQVNYPY